MLGLLLAVTLSGSSCATDADCVLRLSCSCDCCPEEAAMTKADAEADRKRCATLGDCGDRQCKAKCAKAPQSAAVCRESKCVKVALAPPNAECTGDDGCTLRTRCTCDCCHPLEAMTKQQAEAERRRCMAVGPCGPKEGCPEKCPAEKAAVAVCKDGKCVKVHDRVASPP